MSDSDDTDILLLIPPDLFTVASSQSEESLINCGNNNHNNYNNINIKTTKGIPIINELLDHVQSLEERINAIESRNNSLNPSLIDGTYSESRIDIDDDNRDLLSDQYLESTRSILNPPLSCSKRNSIKSLNYSSSQGPSLTNNLSIFKNPKLKHIELMSGLGDQLQKNINDNMAFISVKNDGVASTAAAAIKKSSIDSFNTSEQLIGFNCASRDPSNASKVTLDDAERISSSVDDKFDKNRSISELNDLLSNQRVDLLSCKRNKNHELDERNKRLEQNLSLNVTSTPKKYYDLHEGSFCRADVTKNEISSGDCKRNVGIKVDSKAETPLNTEYQAWQSQRLISLSDFWLPDRNKSEEEMMRIKLEEEKFRREHCEQLIQELQKRLLEQQEKVAVAIRIDKEKSDIILQFQTIWNKFIERWNTLESDHNELQSSVNNMKAKYDEEISNLQLTIKNKEEELLKMNNLLKECEEKRDTAVKEKILLLESHVNELEKYKLLVQTAESRSETLKNDYDKLNESNQQLEQMNKNLQQDLYKERWRSSEVRSEMSVIHKALDTCEAELTVLRQDKENILLKLKEEDNRVALLTKDKILLIEEVNNAKKSENLVREEMKILIAQQELKHTELREIYQNQVDKVVNNKLKEFESQLEAVELTLQMEKDAKQRAIAECAAKKIKNIIDKHQLEINLLEEKHREEKRLCDIRLSQITKRTNALEKQLNEQQNAKSRLADQLHSLMEQQYRQALQIISNDNVTGIHQPQPSNSDKLMEINNMSNKSEDFIDMSYSEPVKLQSLKLENKKNFHYPESGQDYDESLVTFVSSDETPANKLVDTKEDLKKYIKMILQMQEPKKHIRTNIIDNNNSNSSTEVCRESPKKFYVKAEIPNDSSDGINEDKKTRTNTDLLLCHENKYFPIRTIVQMEKQKPPWK